MTGTDPGVVRVYVAADWKYRAFEEVVEAGPDVGEVMGRVMQYEGMRERGEAVSDVVGELVEYVREQPEERLERLRDVDELEVYERAGRFLEREFGADVELYREGEDAYDPGERAESAVPFRPAIHLE